MANNMSGYAGKVSNKGMQVVNSVYTQSASKSPKVKTGGDLRAKKSSK